MEHVALPVHAVTTWPTPRQLSNHFRTVCTSGVAGLPRVSSSAAEGGGEERAAAGEVGGHSTI